MEDRNTALGKPGPFQIIEALGPGAVDLPCDAPRRKYDCTNYDTCLELAAALDWDSFTCRGCNQDISQPLLWRAHQARRKDLVADSLCENLPGIGLLRKAAPPPSNPDTSALEESPLDSDVIDLKA